MKNIFTIILVLCICGCNSKENKSVTLLFDDSVLIESNKHIHSTSIILDSAEKIVDKSVFSIVDNIQKLKLENKRLIKENMEIKKTKIKIDTIYVFEKNYFTKDSI